MKLDDLIESWDTLLHASEGNVVVAREVADATIDKLNRLATVRAFVGDIHGLLKEEE
jgi:hypothetical protein